MSGTFNGFTTLQFTPDNKHAYVYSGKIQVNTSTVRQFIFNTQSEYLIGRITCNGGIRETDTSVGRTSYFEIKFNDEIISYIKIDTAEEDSPSVAYNEIIIPPFTQVEVLCKSDSTDSDRYTTVLGTFEVKGSITQVEL